MNKEHYEAKIKEQAECIENKIKRISELQRDIDSSQRKNAELKQELVVKDCIIKQQVIMMTKD